MKDNSGREIVNPFNNEVGDEVAYERLSEILGEVCRGTDDEEEFSGIIRRGVMVVKTDTLAGFNIGGQGFLIGATVEIEGRDVPILLIPSDTMQSLKSGDVPLELVLQDRSQFVNLFLQMTQRAGGHYFPKTLKEPVGRFVLGKSSVVDQIPFIKLFGTSSG